MMRENIGNILKVVHSANCSVKVAKEALAKNNSWPDTIKYAKENNN